MYVAGHCVGTAISTLHHEDPFLHSFITSKPRSQGLAEVIAIRELPQQNQWEDQEDA